MAPRIKRKPSKAGLSFNPPQNSGECLIVESPPHPRSKRKIGLFSLCCDAMSFKRNQWIFSKKTIINERFIETKTLCTSHLLETIEAQQWLSLFFINDPIQEATIWIFYANFFHINNDQCSFYTTMNKVVLKVNPDLITHFLGGPRVTNNVISFPIHKLTME